MNRTAKADVRAAQHRAVDVPGLRDRLLEGWRNGLLRQLLEEHPVSQTHLPTRYRDEKRGVNHLWTIREWEGWLIQRLTEAELFYVNDDMTDIIEQASLATPGYQVYRDQLPAEVGFMVYAKPFCHVPPERLAPDQRVELMAALWAPVPDVGGDERGPEPGLMLLTLQDSDVLLWTQPTDQMAVEDPVRLEQALRLLRSQYGPLAYHEEYPLPFGNNPYGYQANHPVNNAAVAAAFTTWILMTQKITTVAREPLPRSVRKAAVRAGRPEPTVRTVTLRQAVRAPAEDHEEPGAEGRRYDKRWVVKGYGYWRNTWYASRERHELQYVHVPTYVKGPEGAPLIGGERVNVLRR